MSLLYHLASWHLRYYMIVLVSAQVFQVCRFPPLVKSSKRNVDAKQAAEGRYWRLFRNGVSHKRQRHKRHATTPDERKNRALPIAWQSSVNAGKAGGEDGTIRSDGFGRQTGAA